MADHFEALREATVMLAVKVLVLVVGDFQNLCSVLVVLTAVVDLQFHSQIQVAV